MFIEHHDRWLNCFQLILTTIDAMQMVIMVQAYCLVFTPIIHSDVYIYYAEEPPDDHCFWDANALLESSASQE